MKIDLNQREIAELRRGFEARRKNIARRKPSDKPDAASSAAMEAASIHELDTKLAVAIANDLQKENGQ